MSTQDAFEFPKRSDKVAPNWFVHAARAVPLAILGQFLFAGLSLFANPDLWALHGVLGSLLVIPVAIVAIAPRLRLDIHALRHWGGVLGALYILQIVLIALGQNLGSGLLQALHVFNAGLLLVTAIVIVAKIERSHSG
jgi:hypothetical protein